MKEYAIFHCQKDNHWGVIVRSRYDHDKWLGVAEVRDERTANAVLAAMRLREDSIGHARDWREERTSARTPETFDGNEPANHPLCDCARLPRSAHRGRAEGGVMKDFKATPGPWFVGWNGGLTGPRCSPSCYFPEHVQRIPISSGDEPVAWVLESGSRETDRMLADANLLAAAGDLYEALANIENDDGRIPASIWAMRNAALAKARGETAPPPREES